MTGREFQLHLRELRARIVEAANQVAEDMAVTSLSMIKDRSINEGIAIGGNEADKKEYSTNTYNTAYLIGKELNAGGKAYIKANAYGNWYGFRKAQGLDSEKVNLAYSNRMWTNIQVISVKQTGEGKSEVIISALDAEERRKLEANIERYGDFLAPTPEELEIIQQAAKARLNNILNSRN